MTIDPIQLVRRSKLLQAVRRFFLDLRFVEVETPLLAEEIIPELHIEPFSAQALSDRRTSRQWLQASPELAMKRMVAGGMERIFQITRSFRAGEQGRLHREEFTIVEWYRTGDDMHRGMQLLDELCQATLQAPPAIRMSYAEAFQKHVGICPHISTAVQLAARAQALGLDSEAIADRDNRDEWLNLLLALRVEPHLGREQPVILFDYPASQAALAKTVDRENGNRVAARFELYYHGIELANGYDELTDAEELRKRFIQVNRKREAIGRLALPLPESLLAAMDSGLPACAGCALGFDRLAMLACKIDSINST